MAMMTLRQVTALLPLAFLLLTVGHGHVAVVSATIVVLVVLAVRGRDRIVTLLRGASTRGPSDDERCLHGAFRRHSKPDTPGRPGRPRAPGRVYRPA